MKEYWILFSIVCFISSCSSRNEIETQSIVKTLFEKEILKGYPIYLVEDADFNWFSKSGATVCDEDWFKEVFNWKSDESAKFEKILSEKNLEKLCTESKKNFKFQKAFLPKQIQLVSRPRIENMLDSFDRMIKEDRSVVYTEDMIKYEIYHELSKPVFMDNYQYAFVYRATNCFPNACLGPVVYILEKVKGKWEILYAGNLILI